MTKQKMVAFIYRIDCSCGCERFYVGSTINSVRSRFSQHKYAARKGLNLKLYQHMREVGFDKFSVHILKCIRHSISKPNLREKLEGEYIESLDTVANGFNHIKSGFNYHYEHKNHNKLFKCDDCLHFSDYVGFDTFKEFLDHLNTKEHKAHGISAR
jgi:hypothetical protein